MNREAWISDYGTLHEGWGVSAAEAYPAKLQVLLNTRGIDAALINAGIAGDTTGGMLARLERAVPAGTHLVILQPGTNDGARCRASRETSKGCAAGSAPGRPG